MPPSHGSPIYGRQEIQRAVGEYRDAIQYVHDETVRGMNAGKDVFTLMNEIHLPPEFELNEVYGNIPWSVRGVYEGDERAAAVAVDDRLRGFDHQLELDRSGCQVVATLEMFQEAGQGRDLLGDDHLWQRDDEIVREPRAGLGQERRKEQVERACAATRELLVERFDPDSDEWRQRRLRHALDRRRLRG